MDAGRLVLVIVPAYNEGRVVTATVERLLAAGYQVVVVDDGSSDETAEVRHLPVVYLRHAVNLGQGAALQTGMTYALRAGADIAVHFDADGQHDCGQIERLIAPIVEGKRTSCSARGFCASRIARRFRGRSASCCAAES